MKSGHEDKVAADIQAVVDAGHKAGADFVKTSTGFSKEGATVHAVEVMAAAVKGTGTAVKASGGIHSKEEAEAMVNAGATRLGVSHSMKVIGKE